jgi:hypothetical protein
LQQRQGEFQHAGLHLCRKKHLQSLRWTRTWTRRGHKVENTIQVQTQK